MTRSYWQRQIRNGEMAADVAIVGGGIIGSSTAYWVRRLQPQRRVVIVEAGTLAQGASGRNAGFLIQGGAFNYAADIEAYGLDRARQLWHFTQENRDLIATELHGRAFEFEASGSLRVAGSPEEDEQLRTSVTRMQEDGAPVTYIPKDEVNRRLHARGFGGALYVSSGAMLNPVLLVRHIAVQSEATLLTHHRVLGVEPCREGVLLDTVQRPIRAGQVVLAMNSYLPQLIPALQRVVRPVRAQMLATAPIDTRWLHMPVYSHQGYYYLRQQPDGTVLLGGARHLHVEKEVGYRDETTPELQADLERYLHMHFPQTEAVAIRRRWSGVMGFSPDHLPIVGTVPGVPGSIWAGGFSGHGMAYGFRFGRLLAEMVGGAAQPDGLELFTDARSRRVRFEATPTSSEPK